MSDTSSKRRVLTPVGRLSYPHVFSPQEPFRDAKGNPQGDPKYSGVIVFDEEAQSSDQDKAMQAAVVLAGKEKFGKTEFGKLVKAHKLSLPFNDDWEEKGYPENSTFINAKSTSKPQVVGRYKDPETGKARRITDPEEVYPGMYVVFSVTAFGYDVRGNKGVSFAINNIQKWDDGERFDSRVAAEDEFDAEAPVESSLEDLEPKEDEDEDNEGTSEGLEAFM